MQLNSTNPTPTLLGYLPSLLAGVEVRGGTCGVKKLGFATHPENICKNPRKRFTKTCEHCGKLFERQEFERKRARFCSRICFRDGELRKGWKVRFPQYISKTKNCWEWTGNRTKAGYGKMTVCGKSTLAHRLAWELKTGNPPDGFLVCHTCDNPGCVNPDHLFLGNHKDNTHDMITKGRASWMKGITC